MLHSVSYFSYVKFKWETTGVHSYLLAVVNSIALNRSTMKYVVDIKQ